MDILNSISEIKKVPWSQLKPGMVVVDGITVNGVLPQLLWTYPVLTPELIRTLNSLFVIKPRLVSVVEVSGTVPGNLHKALQQKVVRLEKTRSVLTAHRDFKKSILSNIIGLNDINIEVPVFHYSDLIDSQNLLLDRYSSFSFSSVSGPLPSLFHMADKKWEVADILNKQIMKSLNIPQNQKMMLHIGIDFSYSMKGNMSYVMNAVNPLLDMIQNYYDNTSVLLYAFSDLCRVVQSPIRNNMIEMGETNYSAFIKKMLHNRDSSVPNKIILLTDGRPSDYAETVKFMKNFKKQKIDYVQIVFKNVFDRYIADTNAEIIDGMVEFSEEALVVEYTKEEAARLEKEYKESFTNLAGIANGNQIILNYNEILQLAVIEYWDQYMGFRTIQAG